MTEAIVVKARAYEKRQQTSLISVTQRDEGDALVAEMVYSTQRTDDIGGLLAQNVSRHSRACWICTHLPKKNILLLLLALLLLLSLHLPLHLRGHRPSFLIADMASMRDSSSLSLIVFFWKLVVVRIYIYIYICSVILNFYNKKQRTIGFEEG